MPQYQFASSVVTPNKKKGHYHHHGVSSSSSSRHRRTYSEETDNTDAGSLTYSATSSVQSGGSAAGESTDSSFADIMRVLDLQDTQQLKELIEKEGVANTDELYRKRGGTSSVSVASSLQYSTDGESHLEGTKLLQTIAGQPSDSFAFDGGGGTVGADDKMDLLFAPAAPAVVKKTKGNKVVLGKDKNTSSRHNGDGMSTPKSKSGSSRKHFDIMSNITGGQPTGSTSSSSSSSPYGMSSPSSTRSTPTKSPPPSSPGTPPLPKRKSTYSYLEGMVDEDDPLYKEWWMSCFGDALQGAKNLMFKK